MASVRVGCANPIARSRAGFGYPLSTVNWYGAREPAELSAPGSHQPLGLRLAGAAVRRAESALGRLR
jgi:hypothetical protein